MEYAVIENGKPRVYVDLPKSYHSPIANVLGGFNMLSRDELAKHGFYIVEEFNLTDPLFERRGEVYFDETAKVFKYRSETKVHPEVDVLKRQKLDSLEKEKKDLLQQTNDVVLEALELGEVIPTDISSSRANIRTQEIKLKNEINTLSTQRDLLSHTKSIII